MNLKKNDVLDLTKKNPSIKNIRLGAGWDVVKKGFFNFAAADFDLDLVALLLNENGKIERKQDIIYYGNQIGNGIKLHGDNLTGEGEGDDEKVSVDLTRIPNSCNKILFAVIIYQGQQRRQSFKKVRNAYVRLLDENKNDMEICRYNLTEDGGDNTGIKFAELNKQGSDWEFRAIGELFTGSVETLVNSYK